MSESKDITDRKWVAGAGKPSIQELSATPAEEELAGFDEGNQPLPEGCKIIKEWKFSQDH